MKSLNGEKQKRFFLIIFVIIILDQIVKQLVLRAVSNGKSLIGEFLRLDLIKNYGAGFGIFQGQRIILILISLIVIGVIIYNHKIFMKNRLLFYGFALITGGAVGNLIDRIIFGYVIDFINISFWPAFNIADSAITIGAILVGYCYLFSKEFK